jgi:hypothetical protein
LFAPQSRHIAGVAMLPATRCRFLHVDQCASESPTCQNERPDQVETLANRLESEIIGVLRSVGEAAPLSRCSLTGLSTSGIAWGLKRAGRTFGDLAVGLGLLWVPPTRGGNHGTHTIHVFGRM